MGLLDKLQDKGSVLSNANGTQPTKKIQFGKLQSEASALDLDMVKPKTSLSDPRYLSDKPLSFKKGTYIDKPK